MQLALAHHTQRFRRTAINRHLQRDAAPLSCPFEFDAAKVDVALKPQLFPHGDCPLGNRRETLVPHRRARFLPPVFGCLQLAD